MIAKDDQYWWQAVLVNRESALAPGPGPGARNSAHSSSASPSCGGGGSRLEVAGLIPSVELLEWKYQVESRLAREGSRKSRLGRIPILGALAGGSSRGATPPPPTAAASSVAPATAKRSKKNNRHRSTGDLTTDDADDIEASKSSFQVHTIVLYFV